MENLDKLITPNSGNNLDLLRYLLMLGLFIFSVYSTVLFGSSLLSYFFNIKARKSNNQDFRRISIDYINLITPNKTFTFGLGIVPFIGIILIYAQLLHETHTSVVSFLVYSFVLFLISLILLLIYKNKMNKNDINKTGSVFCIAGLIFLLGSLFILMGAASLALDTSRWEAGTLNILLSFETIIKLLNAFTISLALTGAAFVIKYYIWDKNPEVVPDEYYFWARKYNLWLALIFTFTQPVFFVLNLFTTPIFALTPLTFGIVLVALLLIFLALHLIYSLLKNGKEDNQLNHAIYEKPSKIYNLRGATWAFYILLSVFAFMILKDQIAFGITSRGQILKLADAYNTEAAKTEEKYVKKAPEVNGEEIYQTKCTACHKFDVKFVGPPHKEVMVKYAGKPDDMVKFILDPVKVNPDYPQMPNQGLKTEEAKAVVEYMYKHFGDKLK